MKKELETLSRLDICMKELTLEMGKYVETDSTYKELAGILVKLYLSFKSIYEDVSSKTDNEAYFLEYANIDQVKKILMNAFWFAPTKEEANNITVRR